MSVQRLLKRADFVAAARGRRFHTERMTVQGLRAPVDVPERGLRLGLTLTKKVGHATERNRIRRRLRAAAAVALPPFSSHPIDIVVIGRREAIACPFPILIEDLSRALASVTRPAADGSRGGGGRRSGSRADSLRGDDA
ncbi:ribonuclease P protein component [Enterovirga rhinocerotis]|uniref:Ribonuclease P protein component n=1 Tax=Enterovirga rhinocerotis TaxID=1339210 RepID=A0A4R7C5C9_9HYPH|nr:ribonuclease P protein component [Enterovirga rhinocerotis]TDR93381.1 ribonuclease P protein component [Enterovirga rhinocerotis]